MNEHVLITERCRLRRLSHDDAPYVVSACKTPGFTDGMTWDPVETIEETRDFTNMALEWWQKRTAFVWTIEDKSNGSFIGRIEVRIAPKLSGNVWELGYWIHPTMQGQGYATEAAHAVIRFAFEELNADAIVSSHHHWNAASGKVLMKIGMKHTGFSDDRVVKHGKPVRMAEFWLYRKDWLSDAH